mgnify:CR=1 FL=1
MLTYILFVMLTFSNAYSQLSNKLRTSEVEVLE